MNCIYCGGELEDEELDSPYKNEDGDLLCDDCYSFWNEYECSLCGYNVTIIDNLDYIIVTRDLAEAQKMQPGIYRILANPWYSSTISPICLMQDNLQQVADFPEGAWVDITDYVCTQCALKIASEQERDKE